MYCIRKSDCFHWDFELSIKSKVKFNVIWKGLSLPQGGICFGYGCGHVVNNKVQKKTVCEEIDSPKTIYSQISWQYCLNTQIRTAFIILQSFAIRFEQIKGIQKVTTGCVKRSLKVLESLCKRPYSISFGGFIRYYNGGAQENSFICCLLQYVPMYLKIWLVLEFIFSILFLKYQYLLQLQLMVQSFLSFEIDTVFEQTRPFFVKPDMRKCKRVKSGDLAGDNISPLPIQCSGNFVSKFLRTSIA